MEVGECNSITVSIHPNPCDPPTEMPTHSHTQEILYKHPPPPHSVQSLLEFGVGKRENTKTEGVPSAAFLDCWLLFGLVDFDNLVLLLEPCQILLFCSKHHGCDSVEHLGGQERRRETGGGSTPVSQQVSLNTSQQSQHLLTICPSQAPLPILSRTSSTLIFSLALVSNSRTPIWSLNRRASAVSTCFRDGSSLLLPTVRVAGKGVAREKDNKHPKGDGNS